MESLSMKLVPVFDWLLRTTLQAALLLCLILLVQLILRRRLPMGWHYCLWLLLLIRMATPWLPESRISIFNWVPRSIQQGGIIEPLLQPQDARGMGFYLRAGTADTQEVKAEAAIVKFARRRPETGGSPDEGPAFAGVSLRALAAGIWLISLVRRAKFTS